jgi:hypothetical protein
MVGQLLPLLRQTRDDGVWENKIMADIEFRTAYTRRYVLPLARRLVSFQTSNHQFRAFRPLSAWFVLLKEKSRKKSLPQVFLLRSPFERTRSVLTCRARGSVAGMLWPSVLGFLYQRFSFASNPPRSLRDFALFCAHPTSKTVALGRSGTGRKAPVLGRRINTIANHHTLCER